MCSAVKLGEIYSPNLPSPVPYSVVIPASHEPLPLCVLLMGAGGSRDSLCDLQPVLDGWWAQGEIAPMAVATPSAGLDYYLEKPAGPLRWDSFLVDDFIPHVRKICELSDVNWLAGISGGGYGALKLAFARPKAFAAVAAVQPMLEPGFDESQVGPRNRLHHVAGGPADLIGAQREASIWAENNPANRARQHAQEILDANLVIYLEVGDSDFLNAQDGTEFLHRVLWDLDIPHEYRLLHGADHGGPSMRPRLKEMFCWLSELNTPRITNPETEKAADQWLTSGMAGKPPEGATATRAFIQFMRARFEPLRVAALQLDATTANRFGKMPEPK